MKFVIIIAGVLFATPVLSQVTGRLDTINPNPAGQQTTVNTMVKPSAAQPSIQVAPGVNTTVNSNRQTPPPINNSNPTTVTVIGSNTKTVDSLKSVNPLGTTTLDTRPVGIRSDTTIPKKSKQPGTVKKKKTTRPSGQ